MAWRGIREEERRKNEGAIANIRLKANAPNFERHFQKVINLEGGFRLHVNPTEKAEIYAGI